MRFYLSYNQLKLPASTANINKKEIFKKFYLKSYKTVWPYIGLVILILCSTFANHYLASHSLWERGLIVMLGGFIYFHFHSVGIQKLINTLYK